jgi:hypothetical protein
MKKSEGGIEMADETTTPKRKRNRLNWLLWWQIDDAELAEHVAQYDTMKFYKSARGASLFCILFSMAVTLAFTYSVILSRPAVFADAALWLLLAVFVALGHRWAFIAAMIYWTLGKVLAGMDAIEAGSQNVFWQVIWWCIYMHAFWFAFRVEQERKKAVGATSAA